MGEIVIEKEGLSIKKLNVQDARCLSEVALKAYSDHYLDLWCDRGKWYMEKYFSVDRLGVELQDRNAAFYLAFYNNSPVGFLKLNLDAPLAGIDLKSGLELERIYLVKETLGKGIGKELVSLTVDIGKKLGKDLIWLKAMDTSDGPISFYQKMGFRIVGTQRLKHPLMKEELRGMVVMMQYLSGNHISP